MQLRFEFSIPPRSFPAGICSRLECSSCDPQGQKHTYCVVTFGETSNIPPNRVIATKNRAHVDKLHHAQHLLICRLAPQAGAAEHRSQARCSDLVTLYLRVCTVSNAKWQVWRARYCIVNRVHDIEFVASSHDTSPMWQISYPFQVPPNCRVCHHNRECQSPPILTCSGDVVNPMDLEFYVPTASQLPSNPMCATFCVYPAPSRWLSRSALELWM